MARSRSASSASSVAFDGIGAPINGDASQTSESRATAVTISGTISGWLIIT